MLAVFDIPETSKHLYFNLNNSLHLANPPCSPTYKMAGLYAIYKNDICYYVGQSKNLPSRISTHLTGKYKSADRVDVYFIGDENQEGFYSNSKEGQKSILENNENWLISRLKPIENILVGDGSSDYSALCYDFVDNNGDLDCHFYPLSIYIDNYCITITESGWENIEAIHADVMDNYIGYVNHIRSLT